MVRNVRTAVSWLNRILLGKAVLAKRAVEVGVEEVCRGDFGSWMWGNGIRLKVKNFNQIGVKRRYCYANP